MGFLAFYSFRETEATTITQTSTFYSQTYDASVYFGHSDYYVAHDYTSGNIWSASYFFVGQTYSAPTYYVFRGFPIFDTSPLDDGVNITIATLQLYVQQDYSDTNFNVTVENGMPTYPHLPIELNDYYNGFYEDRGEGGEATTAGLSDATWLNITLNSTGLAWISKTGYTKLCLRSDNDLLTVAPTGEERLQIASAESGESYAPRLVVTIETEGYSYIVHGPYYENGNVASCLVNLTLQIENSASNTTTFLNGTDGVADSFDFNITNRGIALTWNISAPTMNETRMYYLTSATFEEIYVYIPDAGETYNLYLVNIFDFAGLTNATVETQINVGGYTRTVERQELDVSNPMPFYLSWAHHYGLKISSDQGSYTWNIAPTSEQTINKVAEKGMFPISIPGLDVTVQAGWMNSTHIQANYTDSESLTTWINVIFRHRITGGTWTDDYSLNQTGNTVQVNWYSADDETDYRVLVQAMRNGTETNSTIFLPHPAATSNPWDNAFTDLFDDLPFPAKNLIGITIVFFFAGIFSVADRVLGAFVVVIVAGIMTYIGMLDLSWTLVGTTIFIVVLAAIEESKRRQHSG